MVISENTTLKGSEFITYMGLAYNILVPAKAILPAVLVAQMDHSLRHSRQIMQFRLCTVSAAPGPRG